MRNYIDEYYNGDEAKSIICDAAEEITTLRQRVQELEKQRDDFIRDAAEFSGQVSRLVDHNNNLVNHREELILEITRIKRGDFSNERIENDSLKLCINVQNEQIEKLTAERDALKQQRDELVAALEQFLDPEDNPPEDTGEWREAVRVVKSIKGEINDNRT